MIYNDYNDYNDYIDYNVYNDLMISPRHWSTRLVSSRASLTSWGEGASLALVCEPSSDAVTIKCLMG